MVHSGITDTHAHLADPLFDKDRVDVLSAKNELEGLFDGGRAGTGRSGH